MCKKAIVATHAHGILHCKKAIVATSIKYYKAKWRLSPRAWNSKVQNGDCSHTGAWNTTLQKRRSSPRASNTTVQKGDCRHTRAWTITMQKIVFFLLHTSKNSNAHGGNSPTRTLKKEKHLTAASLPCEARGKQAKVSIVPYRRASVSVPIRFQRTESALVAEQMFLLWHDACQTAKLRVNLHST